MGRISSILSQIEPWRHSTAVEVCRVTRDKTFGMNDPLNPETSGKKPFVPDSLDETANFTNASQKSIHCLDYDVYVKAIPRPHAQPSNCDRILHADDKSHFIFVEMKVTMGNGVKIRQLQKTLQQFMDIADLALFIRGFTAKHCCFFKKSPRRVVEIKAARSFKRKRMLLTDNQAHRVANTQLTSVFQKHHFELLYFNDGAAYQFNGENIL